MKRIAVFCALPPDRNTGMMTVDLAAFSLIKRIAPDAEVTLYVYGKLSQYTYQPGELPYQYLNVEEHSERYLASDIFLFWGDFTHARSYWALERASLYGHIDTHAKADMERWHSEHSASYYKYIFLNTLPESRLKDVIVFGSTVITNDAADEADELYYKCYSHFFSSIAHVYFRDAISAAKVSPLRQNEATLGCDCAFMLNDANLEQVKGFKKAGTRKGIGVFYGRSQPKTKIKMMLFALLVGKYIGERCSWLPWFRWHLQRRRHRWPYMFLGYKITSGDTDPGYILSSLSGYKYIITDTYHLCINAWNMGIPAVCIGAGAGKIDTSLNEKKKEILYGTYGARRFYVFTESLRSLRSFVKEARRISGLLEDKAVVSQVNANISLHRDMSKRRLGDAILTLLKTERLG